jgi:hypothetical protein
MNDEVVLKAEQIGDVDAMYIAAMRGFSLKDVGVNETEENIYDFNKIQAEVKQILENGEGLSFPS